MMRMWLGASVIALGIALMPTSVTAQVADADEWRFAATPWLWLVKMSGTVAIAGRETDVEIDTDEIFDALEFGYMSHVEIGKGKAGFFFQPIIANFGKDGDVRIPGGETHSEVDIDMKMVDFGGAYRVAGPLELVAGGRYFGLDVTAELTDIGEESRDASHWNGFVGARVRHDFAERWGVMVHGDVGFGDSESNYMSQGVLQYRPSPRWGIDLGYKWLHDEVGSESRPINLDTDMYGAVLGVTFRR